MGLQNQLSDVSTESLLISAVVLLARGVGYLHCLLLDILRGLGFFSGDQIYSLLYDSGLNRAASEPAGPDESDCVVCLCPIAEGDHVRRLPCRHVFHRNCVDGWLHLHHHHLSCPLCRAPLLPDDRATLMRRRVA